MFIQVTILVKQKMPSVIVGRLADVEMPFFVDLDNAWKN